MRNVNVHLEMVQFGTAIVESFIWAHV